MQNTVRKTCHFAALSADKSHSELRKYYVVEDKLAETWQKTLTC